MKVWQSTSAFCIAASLAACSGLDTMPPTSGPQSPSAPGAPVVPEAADVQTQTLNTLLAQARAARLAGRLAEAETQLEAALRIEPGNARLWLELAEVRFAGGEFETAAALADRALTLSGDDPDLIEAAQRLRGIQ